ncbi:MAG: UDP-N-acetylmuramoyl-L-alanyl-D-glutamate--2,6-diaminopimelate ligase [Candidatus Berkelbacteria bacterium]|nr:UDP-N-acetylmuramoyl-L-alanyl-D-glutamate--2,6-diaminopimelate ligase [Candidatus Berkelbacteria bacterium]
MKKFIKKFFSQSTKNKYHKLQANLSNFSSGNPSKKIKIIGITGTKGKTTIANLVAAVLDAAGEKNAMETTINTKIGDIVTMHTEKSRWVTTPPTAVINGFLRKAIDAGCKYAILETTSQAIDQYRVWGINSDVLVFSNISHDHIDYHGTKEKYIEAKLKVFKDNPSATAVINIDDAVAETFIGAKNKRQIFYSVKKPVENGLVARKILQSPTGSIFTAVYGGNQTTIDLQIPGMFNISNALAAIAVGIACEIPFDDIKKGLEKVTGVPGRMERIKVSQKQDFEVIVDYAHNADSLKNVYETIIQTMTKRGGKIIAVLGATGRRDKTKRPIMGALAGKFADLIFVTNEDPYDEDPLEIIDTVAAGVLKGKKGKWRLNTNYWKILDRHEAISKAIGVAARGDVVIITGKGAEEVMAVGENKFEPFSDRRVVKYELAKRYKLPISEE